jgi:signal transduction histidine kinase
MSWRSSLRVRVAAALAVTSFAIAGLLGTLIAQVTLQDARAQLCEQAADTLRAGTATYMFTGMVAPSVQLGPAGVPEELLAGLASEGDVLTLDSGEAAWAAWQADAHTVLSVRLPNAPVTDRWQPLSRLILGLAVGAAALSSAAGWFVASRITRRLRAAAEHTAALRAGAAPPAAGAADFAPTDTVPRGLVAGDDEVGVLTRAVEETTRELLARVERERELTADAAHELRTPLTALVSATELLDDGPEAERVRTLVARLRRLVEDMLALAREEASAPAETDVVRTGVLARRVAAVADDVMVRVTSDAPVRCAPDIVVAALASLVANAHRHGTPPVEVVADGASVRVRDHGVGYPAEILAAGPRRFHAVGATGGTGLGLVIAQARAARGGGRLVLRNAANGGAEAVVALTPADEGAAPADADAAQADAGTAAADGETPPAPEGAVPPAASRRARTA